MRFRPYVGAPPGFILTIRPINPAEWMLPDDLYEAQMPEKIERLTKRRTFHYGTLPSSRDAQAELREVMADYLLNRFPQDFRRVGDRFIACRTGLEFDLNDTDTEPLAQVDHWVQEDILILEAGDDGPIVTAASNSHATSGRLVKAVGHSIAWAHGPVPALNERFGKVIVRMVEKLPADRPAERFTWNLMPVGGIFAGSEQLEALLPELPALHRRLVDDPSLMGTHLWIRVERQTLRRLPRTGAIVFTLHTYSDPLSELWGDAEGALALRDAILSYDAEQLDYLMLDVIRDALIGWLERAAAADQISGCQL